MSELRSDENVVAVMLMQKPELIERSRGLTPARHQPYHQLLKRKATFSTGCSGNAPKRRETVRS